MRLVFITPRFGAECATPPELLAGELAARAPGGWRTTVVTTTVAGGSEKAFREGEVQDKGVRVVRFPAEASSGSDAESLAGVDSLTSPGLVEYLRDRSHDYDLMVLFGLSSTCKEAAKLDPGRTVLLPFADDEAETGDSEIFQYPAAFVFGSEAEEILVLKRHQVHRRMRETVGGTLLLPRTADAAAFRRDNGLTGPYLVSGGPLESGRGIEELLRFFTTFKDRHTGSALDLVLFGPAAMRLPQRPDIRVVQPSSTRARRDAVAGAFVAVIPERLAAFSTTAAEPFCLGVPILVNASATELAEECRASGGGLYYGNYDEFELILELGMREADLFPRMGAAGRVFLESRHDWDQVMARYDRAFRSFARPSRGAGGEAPSAEAPVPPEPPRSRVASDREDAAKGQVEVEAAPPAEPAEPEQSAPEPEDGGPADVSREIAPEATSSGEPGEDAGTGEVTETPPEQAEEEFGEMLAASDEPSGPAGSEDTDRDEEMESRGDPGLPSFFRGSIRG